MQPYFGNIISDKVTPGSAYGMKVGYNFNNLGRFVMDNVYPASYSGHGLHDFGMAFANSLNPLSKIPHFNNRLPKSFQGKSDYFGDEQIRLENMAEWVGIPENEIPRRIIFKRDDGTYGFKQTKRDAMIPIEEENLEVKHPYEGEDFTFGVGGEHSNYIYLGSKFDPAGKEWRAW